MLFKLTNTLVSFQNSINKIFVKKLDVFIIVYIDNFLIYVGKDSYINFI